MHQTQKRKRARKPQLDLRVATLHERLEFSGLESGGRVAQVEGVQEVVYLLEVRSNSDNFMNDIFDGDDSVFAKMLFDDSVVGKWNALLVDLAVTALVNKFADGFQVRLPG